MKKWPPTFSQHVQPQQIVHLLQVWKSNDLMNQWEKISAFMVMLHNVGNKSIKKKTKTDDRWQNKGTNKCKHSPQAPKRHNNWLLSWSSSISLLLRLSTYAPQGPELPPNHLAASCAPYNCSPRSALTWEDWLQAAACSSREQAWRRALGGNNFTPDPPLPRPRPQHELRTGFRKREEKHCINQRRKKARRGQGRAGETREEKVERGGGKEGGREGGRESGKEGGRESAETLRGVKRVESRLGRYWNFLLFWKSGNIQCNRLGHMMAATSWVDQHKSVVYEASCNSL